MIRDPLYRDIVERLAGRLDPDLFERCVADLLRDEFPTLVPISGGADAGMDAAIAEGEGPAYPLVCTTAQDVIGNLTKNLDSYVRNGGRRRRVVLVTSQDLTPQRRHNLEKRAEEKGFGLVQIYDQGAVADRLYRSPGWCRELLGLTGTPSALSVVPLTRRPLLGDDLVGRQEDATWLRQTEGDRLIVGPPGCGKTFLLRKLALEGRGLFLASDDPTEVANAVRSQHPEAIFVDDAHLNPEWIVELRRLREEVGAEFSLVATAWTGAGDEVIETLQLSGKQVRDLGLLSRDEIVEVVNNSGVSGPTELVREIVDQAEGRPGLAVSLAYLCLRGGVEEVVLGEALKRSTITDFEKLVGEEATYILAAFSVGGDAGMMPSAVANVLEMTKLRVSSAITRLAAGGVIDYARRARAWWAYEGETGDNTGESPLSVRPPNLRYALVRDIFFNSPAPMPINEFVSIAPNELEVAHTLVRTVGFGASIPSELLTNMLERAASPKAWEEYAALGEAEANWILEHHPEMTLAIADRALERAPKATIPKLLELAVEDSRPLNAFPDHPLRRLGSWVQKAVPGTGRAVVRRKLYAGALADWASYGGDVKVLGQALEEAMSPAFNDLTPDPGSGRMVTMRRGRLQLDELSELEALWPQVAEMLESLETIPWDNLFKVLHDWSYPGLHGVEPSDEVTSRMHTCARQMLSDIVHIADGHPGVLHEASERAEEFGWELGITLDPEYEVLFPRQGFRGNFKEQQERQAAAVQELAGEWVKGSPDELVGRIVKLENAAQDVGHTYPRYTPTLCEEMAAKADNAAAWTRSLILAGAAVDLVAQFLLKAASRGEHGWQELASECLEQPTLAGAAVQAVLAAEDPPEELLSGSLDKSRWFSTLVESLCWRGEVPLSTLKRLLHHEEQDVATAAAIGEWYAEPPNQVSDEIAADWRCAIIGAPTDQHMMQGILAADSALAHDWLLQRVEGDVMGRIDHLDPAVESAVSALDQGQRLSVLRSIPEHSLDHSLAAALVGDDLDLYSEFLKSGKLTDVHLSPLAGRTEGLWPQKARLALDAGFSLEEVVHAVYGSGWSWSGNESAMWQDWADRFRKLLSHEDARIRDVGRYGIEHAERKKERALESERREAVYGSWL